MATAAPTRKPRPRRGPVAPVAEYPHLALLRERRIAKRAALKPANGAAPSHVPLHVHERDMLDAVCYALADDAPAWHRMADAIRWKCVVLAGLHAAARITDRPDADEPESVVYLDIDTDLIEKWTQIGRAGGAPPAMPSFTAPAAGGSTTEDRMLRAYSLIREACELLHGLPEDAEINGTKPAKVADDIGETMRADLEFGVGDIPVQRFAGEGRTLPGV